MLKIRLQRRGKRNYATYRVVLAEHTAPIKGRFIEDLGYYNPHDNKFSVDADKVTEWVNKGAQPSATVQNLLIDAKIITGDKVKSWSPKKKEAEETPEKPVDTAQGKPAEAPAAEQPAAPEEKPEA